MLIDDYRHKVRRYLFYNMHAHIANGESDWFLCEYSRMIITTYYYHSTDPNT